MNKIKTNIGEAQYYYNQNSTYFPKDTWTNNYGKFLPNSKTVNVDIKELMKDPKTHEIKRGEKIKMKDEVKRGLFEVYLVDPKEGKVIFEEKVISDSPEDVLLEVGAGEVIKNKNLKVSEVDKIIKFIGEVSEVKEKENGDLEIV